MQEFPDTLAKQRAKRRLPRLALLLVLVVSQTGNWIQVARNDNAWPFCGYNMFNQHVRSGMRSLRAELTASNGETVICAMGNLMPVEFFRANQMARDVWVNGEDEAGKAALAAYVLQRLNHDPWTQRDEIMAPPRPPAGSRFVKLGIWEVVETVEERGLARKPTRMIFECDPRNDTPR